MYVRVLALDFDPVYGDDDVRTTFQSDHSVFDFDVVIWDPEVTFASYVGPYADYFQGLPSFSDDASVRLMSDVLRRRKEFAEFLKSGRTLVVIARSAQECYIDTGKRTFSGTGRNQKVTRQVESFDLLAALPTKGVKFVRASGDRIQYSSDGPIARLLKDFKPYVRYEATLDGWQGSEIGRAAGTERVVAGVMKFADGGHLILLPAVDLAASDESEGMDEDGYVTRAPEFETRLLEAIEHMSGSRTLSRPGWAKNFTTSRQQDVRDQVAKQQRRVESARTKLALLQQQNEALELVDQLYLGTGRSLELEVRMVLELLGGAVTEPEVGRDDWRVEFPEGRAVVEVKGLSKSAAEKHCAQLEKWVAGELEETGKAPKGILVANTWREVPLNERTESDFPHQMLPYAVSRGHSLVTGLQLFVIRADVERDPERASIWRKKLLTSVGAVEGADGWRELIVESTSSE